MTDITAKYKAALEMSEAIEAAEAARRQLRAAEREVASAQHRVKTAWETLSRISKVVPETVEVEPRDTLTYKEFLRVRGLNEDEFWNTHLVYQRAPMAAIKRGIEPRKVPEGEFVVHTWPLSLWDYLWSRHACPL